MLTRVVYRGNKQIEKHIGELEYMKEDLVPFELAVKLKENGFDYKCHYCYKNSIIMSQCSEPLNHNVDAVIYSAPTISQVLKWLREEKKIYIEIFLYDGKYSCLVKDITRICDDLFHKCLNEDTDDEEYATYEQAALAGIEYVLDNLI